MSREDHDDGQAVRGVQQGGPPAEDEQRAAGRDVHLGANHWDLGFIFTGGRENAPANAAWDELKFVDVAKLRRDEIIRSKLDVLTCAAKLAVK